MDWTNIILAIISLLVAVAEAFLIPWIKTKWDNAKIKEGVDCSEWYKD